jgi:hypothetical protein
MKRSVHFRIPLAFLALTLLIVPLRGQEQKPDAPSPAAMDEMMKKWQEAMTPGEAHKQLGYFVGTWATETKMWMQGPDAPPEITKGTSTMKYILGGRFVQQEMKSTMMGKPWLGIGLLGYDNFKKAYVGSWVDNTATALATMEGTANADHTVFTLNGKMDDPTTGEKDKPVQYVWRIVGKRTHIFEIFDPSIKGSSTKVVEVTYRKK